jgi:hypothetical protein
MIVATVPAAFAFVGVLLYALSASPKLAEIGRILFFCGLLVALWFLHGEGAVRLP